MYSSDKSVLDYTHSDHLSSTFGILSPPVMEIICQTYLTILVYAFAHPNSHSHVVCDTLVDLYNITNMIASDISTGKKTTKSHVNV